MTLEQREKALIELARQAWDVYSDGADAELLDITINDKVMCIHGITNGANRVDIVVANDEVCRRTDIDRLKFYRLA